jgi:hypothetical protein
MGRIGREPKIGNRSAISSISAPVNRRGAPDRRTTGAAGASVDRTGAEARARSATTAASSSAAGGRP